MRRLVRGMLWLVLACLALSVLSVLIFRWVNPPYSAFMAESQISAWVSGERAYVYRRTWADLDRISPNLALAVVASEDQKFPEHWASMSRPSRRPTN